MSSYSGTLLPLFPTAPFEDIDHIIFKLWDDHLEMELASPHSKIKNQQHLDVTAAVIDYWEEKLIEINDYEIQQRRLNSTKKQ